MNKETMLIGVIALLVGGIGGYAIAHRYKDYDYRGYGWAAGTEYPMGKGMRQGFGGNNMPMWNDDDAVGQMMHMMVTSEREFITKMIPHHQEAINTATEVLERGGTTVEIRQLAEGIVSAQTKEIADMKAWYAAWYGESYQESDTYHPMMRELSDLSGAALDTAFLTDMITHHMGAVMMARSVAPYATHDEIKGLAESIIFTQSAEIATMQQMLRGL